jgi:hypothetical protein
MTTFEKKLFIRYFSNYFTGSNDILWTLLHKKILYFQHQIKLSLLNMKN